MIECRGNRCPLVEEQALGKLQHVGVAKRGSNQIVARFDWRRDAREQKELLLLIVNIELQIQFLLRFLDERVTRSGSVDLLQIQALRIVVVIGTIHQEVEAGREVPIMLSIEVEDVGLDGRTTGLADRAVSPGEINRAFDCVGRAS